MSSLRDNIRKMLARPGADRLSDLEIAERVLEMGDEYEWRDAALELMPDAVWGIRRAEARKREREEMQRIRQRQAERDAQAREAGYESWQDWQDAQEQERERERRLDVARRAGYESWEAMQEAAREERIRTQIEIDEQYHEGLRALFAPYVAAMEFTEAFLESEFATGDGRRVTWGDATREDHESRVKFMTKRIEGMEQDVDMHRRVLEVLDGLNVSTLREARKLDVPASR